MRLRPFAGAEKLNQQIVVNWVQCWLSHRCSNADCPDPRLLNFQTAGYDGEVYGRVEEAFY